MSKPVFYHFAASPHSRAALWTIEYLKLDVEVKIVNLDSSEQLDPKYTQINPQHVVPTLQDGDFVLWESRAIATYMVNSRMPGHSIYPVDPKRRAIIDQRLYFDVTILNQRTRDIFRRILHGKESKIYDVNRQALFEGVEWLDGFLEGERYVAGGDSPSIADFFVMASIGQLICIGADFSRFKNVTRWFEANKELPGYAENMKGSEQWAARVRKHLDDKL